MRMEEIEDYELRGRILNMSAMELWDEAIIIWKKKSNYESWGWWRKRMYGHDREEIKDIQMELLDKEVEEAKDTLLTGIPRRIRNNEIKSRRLNIQVCKTRPT